MTCGYDGCVLAFTLHELDSWLNGWANGLQWPVEPIVRLVLAALLGGAVGLEREVRGRQAGFRTNLLVSLGCALVMVVSISFAHVKWEHHASFAITVDPARVAYGVMAGIGFLGAGVIMKHDGSVRGLTTAAGVWCVAAIGLACGLGLYLIALAGAVLVVGALWTLDYVESWMPRVHHRSIVVRRKWETGAVAEVTGRINRRARMKVIDTQFERPRENLATVDIRLLIAFKSKPEYERFEAQAEQILECDLISSASE